MNYAKYFKGKYELGKCDCWTLIRDIYKDEHNMELPSYPFAIEEHEKEFADYLRANLIVKRINLPKKGCLLYYNYNSEHVGYCLNEQQYIHKTDKGTKVSDIPQRLCKFYEIVGVKDV